MKSFSDTKKTNLTNKFLSMEAKKKKRLTIAQLRGFKGYEDISEEDAENTIATLEKVSSIFFELYLKKKREAEQINDSEQIIKNVKIKENYDSKRKAA